MTGGKTQCIDRNPGRVDSSILAFEAGPIFHASHKAALKAGSSLAHKFIKIDGVISVTTFYPVHIC